MKLAAAALAFAVACGAPAPYVPLGDTWPDRVDGYDVVVNRWTRSTRLHKEYQEVLELSAVFKSPEWRAARAALDVNTRGLIGDARARRIAEGQAAAAGPYEVELLVTTWDRRENDLDRGSRSVWRVVLIDESGEEIEPLEIIRDKRPQFTIRAEFPAYSEFATAYVARYPRTKALLRPDARLLRLRMSSVRGGVELAWIAR